MFFQIIPVHKGLSSNDVNVLKISLSVKVSKFLLQKQTKNVLVVSRSKNTMQQSPKFLK